MALGKWLYLSGPSSPYLINRVITGLRTMAHVNRLAVCQDLLQAPDMEKLEDYQHKNPMKLVLLLPASSGTGNLRPEGGVGGEIPQPRPQNTHMKVWETHTQTARPESCS